MCQQGAANDPKSAASRIVMLFGFIFLMFLYVSYSANIVGLLQSTSDNIKTLEDLLESRIVLGLQDSPYNYYWFSVSTVIVFIQSAYSVETQVSELFLELFKFVPTLSSK